MMVGTGKVRSAAASGADTASESASAAAERRNIAMRRTMMGVPWDGRAARAARDSDRSVLARGLSRKTQPPYGTGLRDQRISVMVFDIWSAAWMTLEFIS